MELSQKKERRSFETAAFSRHRMFLYGAATIWIVMSHLLTDIPHRFLLGIPAWIQEHGMCGVEIFLLLSGFGLYNALTRNPDVLRFWKRRLTRVFLPAFIVAVVYCAVNYVPLEDMIYSVTVLPYFFTNRSFWYVAFILVMYAVYPAIYHLQKRSSAAAWVVCGLISALVMGAVMATNCEIYLQRALTRVPVFMLGCLVAPYVYDNRKLPVWSIAVFAAAFAAMEAARLVISPESYALRAITFIPLAITAMMIFTYLADTAANCGRTKLIYRCAGFVGNISLEMYLIFERMQAMLLRVGGYENPDASDILKTDISAFILTVIASYFLTMLVGKFLRDFASVPVPQKKTQE